MRVLVGWGAMLLAGAALMFAFGPTRIEVALLGGAAAACMVAGLIVWRVRGGRTRPVASRSASTTLAAIGVALMVFGAELGPWLLLIGAGVTAIGAGGVLRERWEERR